MRRIILFLFFLLLTTFRSEIANSTFSICAAGLVTGQVGNEGATCIADCPLTRIKFAVNNPSIVTLKVHNNPGKNIANLINENMNEGEYYSPIDSSDLQDGVSFYTHEIKEIRTGVIFKESRKMLIVK